jgi:hypothetical protein
MEPFSLDAVDEVNRNVIKMASEAIKDELARNGNNVQAADRIFHIGKPYINNVRDHGSLGTYENNLVKLAVRVLKTVPKDIIKY